ncbi:MAG: hypothetical protein FWE07_00010 [Turicibacter sp.]|nr:hypothetical protein [Turicibacter sp.]
MKKVLGFISMIVLITLLTGCGRDHYSRDISDLIGSWAPDGRGSDSIVRTYNEDGTGYVWHRSFDQVVTEIEWEYLGDAQVSIQYLHIHASTGVGLTDNYIISFRIDGDTLIERLEGWGDLGMEATFTRVEDW